MSVATLTSKPFRQRMNNSTSTTIVNAEPADQKTMCSHGVHGGRSNIRSRGKQLIGEAGIRSGDVEWSERKGPNKYRCSVKLKSVIAIGLAFIASHGVTVAQERIEDAWAAQLKEGGEPARAALREMRETWLNGHEIRLMTPLSPLVEQIMREGELHDRVLAMGALEAIDRTPRPDLLAVFFQTWLGDVWADGDAGFPQRRQEWATICEGHTPGMKSRGLYWLVAQGSEGRAATAATLSAVYRSACERRTRELPPRTVVAIPLPPVTPSDDYLFQTIETLAWMVSIWPPGADADERSASALSEMLGDPRVGTYAEDGLTRIGAVAIPTVVTRLSENDVAIRAAALRILGNERLVGIAGPAYSAVLSAIHDGREVAHGQTVGSEARRVLQKIDPRRAMWDLSVPWLLRGLAVAGIALSVFVGRRAIREWHCP